MARKPGEKLPSSSDEIDGVTKAAILVLALEPQTASEILRRLDPEALEEVTRELAQLGTVPTELRTAVVEEYYAESLGQQYAHEGGLDYARVLLRETLDSKSAEKVLSRIQTQVQKTPFSFLQ